MNSCMQFFFLGEEGIFTFFDLNNMVLAYRKEFCEKKSPIFQISILVSYLVYNQNGYIKKFKK